MDRRARLGQLFNKLLDAILVNKRFGFSALPSSVRVMESPGLRKASSRIRLANRSNLNLVVSLKISASGLKVILVPVFLDLPVTLSLEVVFPRANSM